MHGSLQALITKCRKQRYKIKKTQEIQSLSTQATVWHLMEVAIQINEPYPMILIKDWTSHEKQICLVEKQRLCN